MKAFILYSTHIIQDNKTIIQLFGRLENSHSFVALFDFSPYFFIREADIKKISHCLKDYKTEKTSFTNFQGEKVTKLTAKNSAELNKLFKEIHKKVETYEADIKPHQQFLIENNILAEIEIPNSEEYQTSEKIDRVYNNPKISPSRHEKPKLKTISIDIESDKHSNNLLCIGISAENYQKNFMITPHQLKNTISCKTEEECLAKFREELLKLDSDIITGWNVIDFDLKYLESLFNKHNLIFDLGRTNEKARLRIESSFFKSSSADIPGRQVLDGLNLIGDPFLQQAPSMRNAQFESYTLEDVAQEILGKGKLIKGKHRHEEIEKLYKTNTKESHQKIVDYNLTDCQLANEILEKTKVIELAIERSQLTGMPLDRITSSIASLDSLYIREARKKGFVSPTTKYAEKKERLKGGHVYSEKAGIFSNVLVLDFKSLYPSIICTFNIDPASHLKKKEKSAIESPNKEYFKNTEGILPEIIKYLHTAREKAKKEKRELASYAIKTIMNSFWGALASPNSRYFNLGMGNAITSFAREIIQTTAKKIEEKGYNVIYLDTDSVFVETNLAKEKANQLGKELQDYINNFYKEYIKQKYSRSSYLELQFDKQYLSLIIPQLRKQEAKAEKAAKKRYAGLIEKDGKEEIEITGLEAIRGDWTEAARDFQKELLNKLFHKQDIIPFIKEYINKINEGKLDSKLIYRKSIRKDLEKYTKTTPPHVKAARKLKTLDSNIIEYIITSDGPEPIQAQKHKIDYSHYIDKQIKPIANQLLSLLGKDFDEIIQNSKQAKLF